MSSPHKGQYKLFIFVAIFIVLKFLMNSFLKIYSFNIFFSLFLRIAVSHYMIILSLYAVFLFNRSINMLFFY